MYIFRHCSAQRQFTRLALLAMLLLALMPTLSRAVAAVSGGNQTRVWICTSHGMQQVNVTASANASANASDIALGGNDEKSGSAALEACGYCGLTGSATVPNIGATPSLLVSATACPEACSKTAPLAYTSPWSPIEPRGPPA